LGNNPGRVEAGNLKISGASNPYKIEKFAKALVNAMPEDNGFSTVIGDTLEIVPLTNPATVRGVVPVFVEFCLAGIAEYTD
jgi:hypothetical protein